jgi:hypothetical protein
MSRQGWFAPVAKVRSPPLVTDAALETDGCSGLKAVIRCGCTKKQAFNDRYAGQSRRSLQRSTNRPAECLQCGTFPPFAATERLPKTPSDHQSEGRNAGFRCRRLVGDQVPPEPDVRRPQKIDKDYQTVASPRARSCVVDARRACSLSSDFLDRRLGVLPDNGIFRYRFQRRDGDFSCSAYIAQRNCCLLAYWHHLIF